MKMAVAVDVATAGTANHSDGTGRAYVTKIGTAGDFWKVGKAKNYAERLKAHRTMSVERLTLHAEVVTEHYGKTETYLKHLLQGHRWIDGEGTELYQAKQSVIDDAIAAARHRAAVVLPRMEEADALAAQVSNGTVLTPDAAIRELYQERLRLKQIEWEAKHEGERIDAELQLFIGAADELTGVATYRSGLTPGFDEARFRLDYPERWESYQIMRHTRPFRIRW
jgi:hypothetical protein